MSCPELENDLRLIAAELRTECEWLANCRHREKAARREIEIAEEQIRALLLQRSRLERAWEECLSRGWRP
jgi:hypothetical protein